MMNTTAEGSNLSTTTRDDHLGDLVYTEVMTADSYTQITGTPLSLGENEAAIYTTENDGTWHEVTLFGKSFSIAAWLPESPTGKHSAYSDREMILVVPDASTLEEVFQLQLQDEELIQQCLLGVLAGL